MLRNRTLRLALGLTLPAVMVGLLLVRSYWNSVHS